MKTKGGTSRNVTRFLFTDFFRHEQPLIDRIRKSGLFVYGVRDAEGDGFTIAPRVIVNRIGFLVTDHPLDLSGGEMTDDELYASAVEDLKIAEKIKAIRKELEMAC